MKWPLYPRNVLYPGIHIRGIQILSRELAEQTTHEEPYVVISITSPRMHPCNLAESFNCKAVLRLEFEDVEEGRDAITYEQGKQIAEFVLKNFETVYLYVIHCEAGQSRSAGVGAAISKYLNEDDTLFFKHFTPNMRVYRKVYLALMESE